MCPGKAYDRSPCGTGTSAKLACLAADGDLEEGDAWVQESIVGTSFVGRFRWQDAEKQIIVPTVTGRAWVTRKDACCSTRVIHSPGAFEPRDRQR
ncbi:MAG: proline racemase family protein [Pirellulaceae bacterium]